MFESDDRSNSSTNTERYISGFRLGTSSLDGSSWRRKQVEHEVIKCCGNVFDSLQNIPEKSELQSHIFKLEKSVQQVYTSEGNAKVFQTCAHVVSELEAACTLFELELPKHIQELRKLGHVLKQHADFAKQGLLGKFTQFMSTSTHRRLKEFSKYLEQALKIERALELRLVVHDFSQWNARAANHLVSGSPMSKLLLVTFRMKKLSIPDRLTNDLDDIEEEVQAISNEYVPEDDEMFEEYLGRCSYCTKQVSKVLDSIIAGKEAFNIQQEEIDSCLSQMKLLRQTNTTMEETPKAAIAVIKTLQEILVSMNQVNILVRGVQAFFKIRLRNKESLRKEMNFRALFDLLLTISSVVLFIAGVVILVIGLLQSDENMTSVGIAMLASAASIFIVLQALSSVKKRKANSSIMPLASKLPVKATVEIKYEGAEQKKKNKKKANKVVKANAVAPLVLSKSKFPPLQEPIIEEGSPEKATAARTSDPTSNSNSNQDIEDPKEAPRQEENAAHASAGGQGENTDGKEDAGTGASNQEFDEEMLKEEVIRYAIHLGMDPEEDKGLFWIAEQAYHAHLPANWAQYADEKGNMYYYNKLTGISSWTHPLEDQFRSLYAQMKASKEKFGSMPSMQQQGQSQGGTFNPIQRFTSDSAFTSDNESEYESDGSRFDTSRDSFSSSFMGSYFSSMKSPREDYAEYQNSQSDQNPQNRSYTSGVTGKPQAPPGEGSSVKLHNLARLKLSESSPAFRKKDFGRSFGKGSSDDVPISARPPPAAFLASLSDSSNNLSMQNALKNIMSNM